MTQIREQRDDLVRRVRFLAGFAGACLVIIAGAFWSVQVVHGSYYRDLAESNRLRKQPIRATRGLIYDHEGHLLVENIPSYDLHIDRTRVRDLAASVRFASEVSGLPAMELADTLEAARNVPNFRPVVLARDLSLAQVSRFEAKRLEHPEFEIDVRHLRLYRHGRQTSHLLGYLAEASLEEVQSSDVYEPGDLVGKKGVEETFDLHLRGEDGERVVVVDSRGRVLEEYKSEGAQPGKPLTLALDLELQQEAERLLRDKVGAIVALDPRDGAVRAMYSSPPYEPNMLARGVTSAEWRSIIEAPNHPLQNRTVQNTYSPGSVFKMVVAAAGLSEGVVSPHDTFYCGGATVIYNHHFRCWKRSGHGTVDLEGGLKGSCDIYFYNVGKLLGIERIAHYSRLFGLGRPTGIELDSEKAGLVPDPEWSLRQRKHPWYPGETISVSIGQGPLLVTPMQIAVATAALANGGRLVHPHLRADEAEESSEPLEISDRVLDRVRHGMWAVVNAPGGTARGSKIQQLEMAGKTGTVQVVAQATWEVGDTLPWEKRDHAWFTSFAPTEDPELVVVVFVEHGGSGSRAAAPIAKALHEKYFGIDSADDGQS